MRIDWHDFITGGGALYLGLALFCGGGAVYTLIHGGAQDDWAETPGVVTMARVAPPDEPGKREKRIFVYEYEVDGRTYSSDEKRIFAYEYEVDGTTYSSDRYSFANVGRDRALGIQRLDPGDRVIVHYDPQNPSRAVLEKREPGFFVYVVLLFGIAFLLASIGSLLARDATALFTSAGIRKLLAGADEHQKEPYDEERRDRSLQDVVVAVREGMAAGAFGEDRAAELLQYATELDLEICRELAGELAAGRDIELSARSIRTLSEERQR
jgi:hypothetical protein